jgi:hypothetical protein
MLFYKFYKNTILFNKRKVFFVNWLRWHYHLQYLFSGALYNKLKCKSALFHTAKKCQDVRCSKICMLELI